MGSGGEADIVLADINLPGSMNGRELAGMIRSTYPATPAQPWRLFLMAMEPPQRRRHGLAPLGKGKET
jgi:CheY-like chemotaxis protein